MNIINLSQQDLENFKLISNKSWESKIYYHNDLAYKIFKRDCENIIGANYTKEQIKEKFDKLILLDSIDLSKYFIKPVDLLLIDNEQRGYTMPFIYGRTIDKLYYLPNETKLLILKQIKKIIEEAHKNNIILSDISMQNFLITENRLGFNTFICDLDNASIQDKSYNVINAFTGGEYLKHHEFNKSLDFFEFNLLILAFLGNVKPYLVFNEDEMERTIFGKNKEYYSLYKYIMDYQNRKSEIILDEIEKKYIR